MLQRISRRAVFRRFAPPAQRHRSGPLTLVAIDRAPDEGAGAGVAMAVGRRVGSAVHRNRLRRQIRAILSELDAVDPLPSGWYLVIAQPSARGCSSAELRTHLVRVLAKAGAST